MRFSIAVLLIVLFLSAGFSFASEFPFTKSEILSSGYLLTARTKGDTEIDSSQTYTGNKSFSKRVSKFGLLVGYGQAAHNGPYDFTTFIFQWTFDIKPLLENKFAFQTSSLLEFIVEPVVSFIHSPDNNVEAGFSLLAKYGYSLTPRLLCFINGGAGALFTSQHAHEISTQVNFIPQLGGGFQCYLANNFFLTIEWRYRHMSNAGIKTPNGGIDNNLFLAGISFAF